MITFKNELPIDHELSLDHLVKVWSVKEAENDDGRWEDYTEYVWWGLEEWMETHCETW
jgi:hypothetical protein